MFGTDLDNDGWEDLVLFSGDSLGTMRNTGGNLAPVQAWSCNAADYALGDMDGDGFKDLVVIRTNSDVVLYPNTGNCTFGPEQLLASAPGSTGSSDIDLADMDGDGRLDVLTCSATGSAAWLGNDLPLTAHATSISAGHAIRVFPNPFTDRTRIVFKEELGADVLIEIRDVQGRLLRSVHGTGSREMMIDRGDLGPGLYLVRALRNNAQFGAARLVVE